MPGGTLQFGGTITEGTIYVSISLEPIVNPPLDSCWSWGQACYQYRSSESGYYAYASERAISLSYTYREGEVERGQRLSRIFQVTRATEAQARITADGYNDYRGDHDLTEADYEYNAGTGTWDVYVSTYGTSSYYYTTERTGTVSGTMPLATITSASLSPSSVTLGVGQTRSLTLTVGTYPSGILYSVSYRSSASGVATFSGGTVTGIGAGSATVYATVTAYGSGDAETASCAVTVTASDGGYVMVYNGGEWVRAVPYIRSDGTWKKADAYVRDSGAWKKTEG